jgi:PAS domain S-box-containing protein
MERPNSAAESLVYRLTSTNRRSEILLASLFLLAIVTYLDYRYFEASLGVFYILPVLVAGMVMKRWQIFFFALLCAAIRQMFIANQEASEAALRFLLAWAACALGGMLVVETSENRRLAENQSRQIQTQQRLRMEAEMHLNLLAESSPAAIFTADERGELLSYNRSALELFGVADGFQKLNVGDHLPVLRDALKLETRASGFRTAAQCTGRRVDGAPFIAQLWFSIYEGSAGRRLAAIAVDSSEDAREREERNLRYVLDNNRIIAGAVSHEIRNICGAISMVYTNLRRDQAQYALLAESEDFRALGSLVEGLSEIASSDLQAKVKQALTPIDLHSVLDDLRVVVEPSWTEIDGTVTWHIPEQLPRVFAEPFGLTQAILNLAQNSLRAVQSAARQELFISLSVQGPHVQIVIEDTGPGISNPSRLFEPFQRGSDHVGLGLYVSRALLRSFGGDLKYEPSRSGCRFAAILQAAPTSGRAATSPAEPEAKGLKHAS